MNNIIELNFSRPSKNVPNFGIELLKTTIFFFILVYHCYEPKLNENKILKIILDAIPLYYPTLFLIYFYFSYNHLSNKNLPQLHKRFLKLIVPYIIWPLIFFIINYLSTDRRTEKYSLYDLFVQLTIGRGIACVFWYQFNLLMIIIIFCLIIFPFKKQHLYLFYSLLLLLLCLEYFNVFEKLFFSCSENIKRSVGRLARMTIFSIIGFILSSYKILIFLKDYRIISMCISFIFSFIILYFKIYISEKYFYEGIFEILSSISFFIFFYMLPFEKITFGPLIFLIKQITSYSSGIYYMHIKIIEYFQDYFKAFEEKTLTGYTINYIICYFICFIGMKTFGKTNLKYLFIR